MHEIFKQKDCFECENNDTSMTVLQIVILTVIKIMTIKLWKIVTPIPSAQQRMIIIFLFHVFRPNIIRTSFPIIHVTTFLYTDENVIFAVSPSVSDLTLVTLFMSLVSNVVNTDNIIQDIFPRWRTQTEAKNAIFLTLNRYIFSRHVSYVKKTDDINRANRVRSQTDGVS